MGRNHSLINCTTLARIVLLLVEDYKLTKDVVEDDDYYVQQELHQCTIEEKDIDEYIHPYYVERSCGEPSAEELCSLDHYYCWRPSATIKDEGLIGEEGEEYSDDPRNDCRDDVRDMQTLVTQVIRRNIDCCGAKP